MAYARQTQTMRMAPLACCARGAIACVARDVVAGFAGFGCNAGLFAGIARSVTDPSKRASGLAGFASNATDPSRACWVCEQCDGSEQGLLALRAVRRIPANARPGLLASAAMQRIRAKARLNLSTLGTVRTDAVSPVLCPLPSAARASRKGLKRGGSNVYLFCLLRA